MGRFIFQLPDEDYEHLENASSVHGYVGEKAV
jgi:hypothetical protein